MNRCRPVTNLREWKSYEPLPVGVGRRQFAARCPQCSATVFGIAGQDIVGPGGLTRGVDVPFEGVCGIRMKGRRRGGERWRSEGRGRGERIEGVVVERRPPRCRAREADGSENGLCDFRASERRDEGLGSEEDLPGSGTGGTGHWAAHALGAGRAGSGLARFG
jgi:hypothetical protein